MRVTHVNVLPEPAVALGEVIHGLQVVDARLVVRDPPAHHKLDLTAVRGQ